MQKATITKAEYQGLEMANTNIMNLLSRVWMLQQEVDELLELPAWCGALGTLGQTESLRAFLKRTSITVAE